MVYNGLRNVEEIETAKRHMRHLESGLVHLYTGNGKGKTTAALGLVLRAAGRGLKVFIAQFGKGSPTGELQPLKKLSPDVVIRQYGAPEFIRGKPTADDRRRAAEGLAAVVGVLKRGKYDMVVLDEICGACRCRLIPQKRILSAVKNRLKKVEVVMTGRNAPAAFYKTADLVTEMREIKHYFYKGVAARKGIEY